MGRTFLSSAPRDQGLEIKMFNLDNTSDFSQADCDLMNQAVALLMERDGIEEYSACDIVNNNWQETGNTVESLAGR